MGKQHEWKARGDVSIQVNQRWNYGFQYFEADMDNLQPPKYNVNDDQLVINGINVEGVPIHIRIGAEFLKTFMPQFTEMLALRDRKRAEWEALPICDSCGKHKKDAGKHEYKGLKLCGDCHQFRTLVQLDAIVAERADREEAEKVSEETHKESMPDSDEPSQPGEYHIGDFPGSTPSNIN